MPGMYGVKAKNKTSNLKARIENVDEMGLVTLRFNLPLYNITNLTYIYETVLKLDIIKANSDKSRNLNFTWRAVNMTEKELMIQLKFVEPRSVSIYTVSLNVSNNNFCRFVMILSWRFNSGLRPYSSQWWTSPKYTQMQLF